MYSTEFNSLNKQQLQAVNFVTGPSIILAGAGSGKTRVLVYKVLNLIQTKRVSPKNIVMITFTNKAAGEMKKRILKWESRPLGFIGTFHSFCALFLRRNAQYSGIKSDFIIFDEDDKEGLIKSVLKDMDIRSLTLSYVLHTISIAKNQLVSPHTFTTYFPGYQNNCIAEVYAEYQKKLKQVNALDFDDLIMKTVETLQKEKIVHEYIQEQYTYLFVDEFQDTNYAQYILSKLLAERKKNITVVGDFSQSIYSWRGADVQNLEKFQRDFPEAKLFYLDQNYRSTKPILDFAHLVISKNSGHPVLHLRTNKKKGEEILIKEVDSGEEEAHFIVSEIERFRETFAYSDVAILYRINAQSRIFEEVFLQYDIPYLLIGGVRFYERKEIKDVLSYLRLVINPKNTLAQERLRKLGKKRWKSFQEKLLLIQKSMAKLTTVELIERIFSLSDYLTLYDQNDPEDYTRLENIKELKSVAITHPNIHEFLQQIALVESEYSDGEKKKKGGDGVKLMTLHQAKGLEFPVVFLVGVEEGILPYSKSIEDQYQLEEERRLMYVGITRAKERLYITHSRRRFIFGRLIQSIPSRFIAEEDIEW